MTREQHLTAAKQRALEYLRRGELANAVTSMISDMQEQGIESVNADLIMAGGLAVNNRDVAGVRRFIEGFK